MSNANKLLLTCKVVMFTFMLHMAVEVFRAETNSEKVYALSIGILICSIIIAVLKSKRL